MKCFRTVVNNYHGDSANILENDPAIDPEDNAAVMFTSGEPCVFLSLHVTCTSSDVSLGTTGLPKGVLSTQRQFLTNVLNVCHGICFASPV
jgi:acyl-CoA synthetase (AMP-forming)/AMP-acid ligase II